MPLYRDTLSRAQVSATEAIDFITNGLRSEHSTPPTIDPERRLVVIESEAPIALNVRGCTWPVEARLNADQTRKAYRAAVELGPTTGYDEAAAALAKRHGARVLTGPIEVPRGGARRVLGVFFSPPAAA